MLLKNQAKLTGSTDNRIGGQCVVQQTNILIRKKYYFQLVPLVQECTVCICYYSTHIQALHLCKYVYLTQNLCN